EDVERLRRLALQAEPGVSERDVHHRLGVGKIGEFGLGNIDDLRVDVVEVEHVAVAAVRGERAAAEADHADAPPGPVDDLQHETDAARRSVVSNRLVPPLGRQELLAVHDDAVDETPLAVRLAGLSDGLRSQRPVEIALEDMRLAMLHADLAKAVEAA